MDENGDNPIPNSDVLQAQQLYKKSVELEKELKLLVKKKNYLDKNVVAIRNALKETYEKLLFLDFDFASSQDIEHLLWKTAFYKLIEEYRKRIRQSVGQINKIPPGTSASKEKEDLQKLCDSFKNFLQSATKFYRELIKKFQKAFDLKLDGSEYDGTNAVHKSYLSCHRCTIFLGDLARYHRDLHNHPNQKDWTTASTYYRQALQLIPDNGNPHNQLAVLATYVEEEFVAVYHYFLSLACTHPFATAKDNLLVLFDKNRVRLEGLHDSSDPQKLPELRKFLIKFIRLHGILYTKTSIEKFDELENESLRQFDKLLSKGQLNDDTLFMMFVINIFSTHNNSLQSQEPNASYVDSSQRALFYKYAYSLGLRFFSHTLKIASQYGTPRHVISIGVYVEFLKTLEQLKNPEERDIQTWTLIWREYSKLLTIIGSIDSKIPVSKMPTIREEIELRGFTPLLSVYRMLPYPLHKVTEEQTELKRLAKIKEFGAFVIQELPKTPLFYDAENNIWSDHPVQPTRKEEKRTISPIQIPSSGNMGAPKEQITPRLSVPVDAMNEEVPEETISEKLEQDEFRDDSIGDEVILYQKDEHDHKAVGCERIERSASSEKHGEPTSPRTMNQAFLFPQSPSSNSSFFSFNSLFPQGQQTNTNNNNNSFFGESYANSNGVPTAPNGNVGSFPPNQIQNTTYPFPQNQPFNNANNMNLRNDNFGSFWSPGASNSFFVPQQGEKVGIPYVPNAQPNPFVQQPNNTKAQNVPQQPIQANIWNNGTDGQQMNNFGNQAPQPGSPNYPFNPALPFPFPGGANAQQARFRTKNPFIS